MSLGQMFTSGSAIHNGGGGGCSPVRREMEFSGLEGFQAAAAATAAAGAMKMVTTSSEERLENAMSLLRKTMEFLKSEYEMDTVVLTSFAPKSTSNSHNPFASMAGLAPQSSGNVNNPNVHNPTGIPQPSAGYHSSSGVAADFLHTPAGRHVITCWHQYCQGNAIFMSATASSTLKLSYSEPETAAVSFNLPIQLRPTSVSPCSSVESGESLDSNENMIYSSAASLPQCRKRPRNFLVNSLMTATNQLGRKRRTSLSQSESLKCSESPSPIVTPSEFASVTQSEHDLIKEEIKNADVTDTSQVLDLSTNNTPTTPPPELEHPSDAFGLLAAIKEEERQNLISPEKFRSRGAQIKEEPPNFGSSDNNFLTNSPPTEESLPTNGLGTPKTRSRDELKSFIRAYGPIKKRSASLSSDADFSHRYPNLNSSVPSSLAEESDFDSGSIDGGTESKSSRCSAGTLHSSTGSTTDSDSLWSCPKCKKVMKKKCSYRHVKEVHGQNREIVQCPVCFRSFTRKYTLVLHCRNVHPQLDLATCTDLNSKNGDPEGQAKTDANKDELSKKITSKNSSVPNLALHTGQSSSSIVRSQSSEPLMTHNPDDHDTFSGYPQESGHNSGSSSADQSLLGSSASPLMSSMPPLSYLKAQAASMLKRDHNSLSQELVRQSLINPPLNSLELSLRLAQLERTQQRQMQLLANSSDEIPAGNQDR